MSVMGVGGGGVKEGHGVITQKPSLYTKKVIGVIVGIVLSIF